MPDTQLLSRRSTQSTGRLLTALLVGGVTAILDTTIVAIGIDTLTVELNAPVSVIQWVSTGYLLALAIAIPFVSWAQARLGGKRLWLAALGTFVVGSILCASAWNAESLIIFRVIQGLGGGVMFPLMQTLAMQNIDPKTRTRTMATVSLPAALGPILGPVLGGLVLHSLSWRWLFLINVPIGILGLILAVVFITPDHQDRAVNPVRLDRIGACLLVPALAGLLYSLAHIRGAEIFSHPDVYIPGASGALLLVGFIVWAKRRGRSALVDVQLFAIRSIQASSITLTFFGGTLFASNFLLPLYFQSLRGYSVLGAALLLIPQGVGSLVARVVAGQLVDRFGSRVVAVGGSLIVVAATIPFSFLAVDMSLTATSVVLFVRGLGLGIVLIPIMTVAYVDIDKDRMPHASAITRIAQQLGGAFGTALIAVVLSATAAESGSASGFSSAFWAITGITVVAAVVSLLLPSRKHDKTRSVEHLVATKN